MASRSGMTRRPACWWTRQVRDRTRGEGRGLLTIPATRPCCLGGFRPTRRCGRGTGRWDLARVRISSTPGTEFDSPEVGQPLVTGRAATRWRGIITRLLR
jgi:hypothetical protein